MILKAKTIHEVLNVLDQPFPLSFILCLMSVLAGAIKNINRAEKKEPVPAACWASLEVTVGFLLCWDT